MRLLFKSFTALTDEEIVLVHEMRNSDAVRFKMYNQELISQEEHRKWIASLSQRNDCRYFLVYAGEKAIGVVDFTSVSNDSCEWGYYLSPDMQASGYGILLEYYLLKYAFETLGVKKIFCAVLDSNKTVYDTHIKHFGFIADAKYSSERKDGEKKLCFKGLSLLKKSWRKWSDPFVERSLKFFRIDSIIWE